MRRVVDGDGESREVGPWREEGNVARTRAHDSPSHGFLDLRTAG